MIKPINTNDTEQGRANNRRVESNTKLLSDVSSTILVDQTFLSDSIYYIFKRNLV
jgi:hypothetical protein